MDARLNERAWKLAERLMAEASSLGLRISASAGGACVIDAGIEAPGGIEAGLRLAELCLAGLGSAAKVEGPLGASIAVQTEQPWLACLASQFAGWKLASDDYFALGSGPMRAAAAHEPLFARLGYRETAARVVGLLETRRLPTPAIERQIQERCGVAADQVLLALAPTASLAGTVQVVARSIETALHKLYELGFAVRRIAGGRGLAPLPPPAGTDASAMGWTNDAILYGCEVNLVVDAAEEEIAQIGPRLPSSASPAHGRPFRELLREAGGDFYKIDPLLFSPAVVVFENPRAGWSRRFGRLEPELLRRSFAGGAG